MAPNSLSPASVVIDYHSAFGAHKMTIPTLEWNPVPLTGSMGSFSSWDATIRDGEAMVNDLVDLLAPFVPPTTSFDKATAFQQASPTAPNIPRASVVLTQVGTSASANPSAAVSATFIFKTVNNGIAKLVLLDSPFGANWLSPLLPAGFSAAVLALETEFIAASNAWSGRDDTQPEFLSKVTYDINDKLQKMYFG